MKLNIYATKDIKTNIYANIGIGVDDKQYCEYFVKELRRIYSVLDKKEDKKDLKSFVSHVVDSSLVRLGSVDLDNGHLEDDLNSLVYFDKSIFESGDKNE